MGELTTDDSVRTTPSRSSSRASSRTTVGSAGTGCVTFSASGESAGAAGAHGDGVLRGDASHGTMRGSQGDSQSVEGELR
jgi:hypothetical protein